MYTKKFKPARETICCRLWLKAVCVRWEQTHKRKLSIFWVLRWLSLLCLLIQYALCTNVLTLWMVYYQIWGVLNPQNTSVSWKVNCRWMSFLVEWQAHSLSKKYKLSGNVNENINTIFYFCQQLADLYKWSVCSSLYISID